MAVPLCAVRAPACRQREPPRRHMRARARAPAAERATRRTPRAARRVCAHARSPPPVERRRRWFHACDQAWQVRCAPRATTSRPREPPGHPARACAPPAQRATRMTPRAARLVCARALAPDRHLSPPKLSCTKRRYSPPPVCRDAPDHTRRRRFPKRNCTTPPSTRPSDVLVHLGGQLGLPAKDRGGLGHLGGVCSGDAGYEMGPGLPRHELFSGFARGPPRAGAPW